MHSDVGKPTEQNAQSQKLSYWQGQVTPNNKMELKVTTLSVATQGSELEVLLSADLSLIDQIMVRTSAVAIYEGAVDSKIEIEYFLEKSGFFLNLDLSDIFFKRGYQYFSKRNEKYYRFESARFKVLTLMHFLAGIVRRFIAAAFVRIRF